MEWDQLKLAELNDETESQMYLNYTHAGIYLVKSVLCLHIADHLPGHLMWSYYETESKDILSSTPCHFCMST